MTAFSATRAHHGDDDDGDDDDDDDDDDDTLKGKQKTFKSSEGNGSEAAVQMKRGYSTKGTDYSDQTDEQ